MANNNERYWASETGTKLHSKFMDKIDNYYNFVFKAFLPLWRQSFIFYNYALFSQGRLQVVGNNNEYTVNTVNHYKSLVDHGVNMAVSQRPAWQAHATNSDVKSQTQTVFANALLDYYMREKKLERHLRDAVLWGSLYGEGFISVEWNFNDGDDAAVNPDTGKPVKSGDLEYWGFTPMDVIREAGVFSNYANDWVITRKFINKWNLIAQYGDDPEIRNSLINEKISQDSKTIILTTTAQVYNEDTIELFTFYHKKCPAMPEGKCTLFTRNIILYDEPLPYAKVPVYRLAPGNVDGVPFGYSSSFDLLNIQEMLNVLHSTISSNQKTHGVSNIIAETGSVTLGEVQGGMRLISLKAGTTFEPKALNFTFTPAEVFKYADMLLGVMTQLSGQNSVTMGDPEASIKSGAAMALVQAQAVQFLMGLQTAFIQLLEDTGTATINTLKEYASVPRIATIAGKRNKGWMSKMFSSDDLTEINRVQVDAGNPMSKTLSGKINLATMLLQANMIDTPDQLLSVIETGNLDPLIQGKFQELQYILAENESLLAGKQVPVRIEDNHVAHLKTHAQLAADPEYRNDQEHMRLLDQHNKWHLDALASPEYVTYLQLIGQQPTPPSQPAAAAGNNIANGAQAGPQAANTVAADNQPSLPNAPKLPGGQEPVGLPPGTSIK